MTPFNKISLPLIFSAVFVLSTNAVAQTSLPSNTTENTDSVQKSQSSLKQNNPAVSNLNNPAMVNPNDTTGANSNTPGFPGTPPNSPPRMNSVNPNNPSSTSGQ